MLHSALLNVMTAAARKAGRSLKRDFGEVEHLQVSLKGPGNFVTAADRRTEEVLRAELTKARPGYSFLGEEGGRQEGPDKSHCWIVDPLDGTTNFLHGIPQFAISIGLERDGVIVAGVIYNPANEELFVAERGKRAFLNDKRLPGSRRGGGWPKPWWPAACRISAAATSACSVGSSPRSNRRLPACAGSAPWRSISPGLRRGVSTHCGSAIYRPGTWRPAS